MQYWVKVVFTDNEEVMVSNAVRHTISDDMEVLEIEWLYLYRYGHRRAKFTINNRNLEKKVWLTP